MEFMEIETKPVSSRPAGWGTRHTLTLLGFWGFAVSYSMRFNLSIAIVAMVNSSMSPPEARLPIFKEDQCYHTEYLDSFRKPNYIQYQVDEDTGHNFTHYGFTKKYKKFEGVAVKTFQQQEPQILERRANNSNENDETKKEFGGGHSGEFNWDEETQGVILGSFFWGYIFTQIPGGYLGHKFGGKWPFGIGLLVTAVFTMLIPLSARLGQEFIMCTRVIQGLGEGVTMPAMHSILAKWVPMEERSRLSAAVYAGMSLGTAMTTFMSGYIIHYLGWPAVFYISGSMTLIWFICWTYYVFDSPNEHPRISQEELKYITMTSSFAQSQSRGQSSDPDPDKSKENRPTPWKEIITSVPFWAILLCQTLETWGIYTLLHEIPSYMKNVLHFNLKENSLLSAFPHLLSWLVTICVTHCGDWLIERNFVSVVSVRKTCNTIALWGTSAAMIGIAYSGCDRTATVTLITLAIGVYGAILGGSVINLIDIAPNYASILMGIVNTCATFSGFGSPWLAGIILNGKSSLEEWRYVFLIAAAICFTGNLIYILMASGKEQKWNRGKQDPTDGGFSSADTTPESANLANIMELHQNRFVIQRELMLEAVPTPLPHFPRSAA